MRSFVKSTSAISVIAWLFLLFLLLCGCGNSPFYAEKAVAPAKSGEGLENDLIALPAVEYAESSVADLLYRRVSRRNFSSDALDLHQIGTLLWSAGGVGVDGVSGPTRTIPSAGATYPLDIYLLAGNIAGLEAGIYGYDYINHALYLHLQGDRRKDIAAAALNQDFIAAAPAIIVFVATYERTTERYGDRGIRYVFMDCGYASQNIYLMATEMSLITVAVGAFNDDKISAVLQVSGEPVLIMPVGFPDL